MAAVFAVAGVEAFAEDDADVMMQLPHEYPKVAVAVCGNVRARALDDGWQGAW